MLCYVTTAGITPLQSVYNTLIHEWKMERQALLHCIFVWSVRQKDRVKYLTDSNGSKEYQLGVLPPFYSPLLLQHYEDTIPLGQPTLSRPLISTQFYLTSNEQPHEGQGQGGGGGGGSHIELTTINDSTHSIATDGSGAATKHLDSNSNVLREVGQEQADCAYDEWLQRRRVDLDATFQKMLRYTGGAKRCAVLVCGPARLMSDVAKCCGKYSNIQMTFDLHEESFLL
jgi:hypothetical protein